MNKLTLILHLYKNTKHLDKCIESILAQTSYDFELIIVNDFMLSAVSDILEKHDFSKIKSIKFVSFNENIGHSWSFLYASKKATSDYIYYFGSNTLLKPNFVEKINELIKLNPDVDVINFSTNDKKGSDISKENIARIINREDFIANDIMIRNRDKVISKAFMGKNRIEFRMFKHYSLLFLLDLLNANPKWLFFNEQLISMSSIDSYSYNLYDILEQCDIIFDRLKNKESFEFKHKEEVEYFMILSCLYIFIVKFFKSKNNNRTLYLGMMEAYNLINDNIPKWRQNKYLDHKLSHLNSDIIDFIKNFKPYQFYIKRYIKKYHKNKHE